MKKTQPVTDKSQIKERVKGQRGKVESAVSKMPFVPVSVDFDLGFSSCERAQSKRTKLVGEETVMDKKVRRALEKEQCALTLYRKRWGAFSTVMIYLLEYVQQVYETTRKSVLNNLSESYWVLRNMIIAAHNDSKKKHLREFTVTIDGKRDNEKFSATFPIVDEDNICVYNDYIRAAIAAPRILAETSVQQTVNAWEQLLGRLLGIKYCLEPQSVPPTISANVVEILDAESFDGIRNLFENKAIKEFLKNSTEDQLKELNKELKINFADMFESKVLNELKEIVLRRHLIVHCDSIAVDDYCKEIKKLGLPEQQKGKTLFTDVDYAIRAWDVIFAAGIIIAHMACLKCARGLKSNELERFANWRLVSSSFDALKHERNDAARLILEYANKLKIQTDWEMLAVKINLGIVYKREKRHKEMSAVLDEHNWEYAPKEFKAAALALKGETKRALSELFKWCGKDMERIKCAHEWIVFEDLRKDPEFEKRMAKLRVKGDRELIKITAPSVNAEGDETTRIERLNALFEAAVKYAYKD